MKKESHFNQWLTKQFYEAYDKHITVQRIETTTGNGVPDLLILTKDSTWLIESKFETTNLRSEQKAWQIKANAIQPNAIIVTLCAYPKTKRLVVQQYGVKDITEDFFEPIVDTEFTLDNEGIKELIKLFSDPVA